MGALHSAQAFECLTVTVKLLGLVIGARSNRQGTLRLQQLVRDVVAEHRCHSAAGDCSLPPKCMVLLTAPFIIPTHFTILLLPANDHHFT